MHCLDTGLRIEFVSYFGFNSHSEDDSQEVSTEREDFPHSAVSMRSDHSCSLSRHATPNISSLPNDDELILS